MFIIKSYTISADEKPAPSVQADDKPALLTFASR